jgi:dTDP-4-amino-4,6-dideoxygalactose transaminase
MALIPVNDLARHNGPLLPALEKAARAVLCGGWYVLGPEVRAFEAEFSAFCGVAHTVGVGNGTDALELALRAAGVEAGDAVAAVANAGGYATAAIEAIGACPRYVDVDPCSLLMDPSALARAAQGLRAVVVTHLYGRMANMPAILAAAGGVPVIEDCAQAHGARLGGVHAGGWGAAGCFSFYPTKNLGALGDGGAVITRDAALAEGVRALRQYGWSSKYHARRAGRNSRLDELQAALLRVKLPYLEGWNQRRREIANLFGELLAGLPLQLPAPCGPESAAHLYVVRTPARTALRQALEAAGIGSDVHYPVPDHRQEAARGKAWSAASLPVTERCAAEVLTLPCFPEMSGGEVRSVAAALGARVNMGGS